MTNQQLASLQMLAASSIVGGDIRALLTEYERLRDGVKRIADGYGGDVGSFAQNLLKVITP